MRNMKSTTVLIFIVCLYSSKILSLTQKNGKFFPFWGVGLVRFENSICRGAEGLEGTCYTRRQCRELGGVGSGGCASGLGTCCIFQVTCGGSSFVNNSYFVNPNFPKPISESSTCTVTIQKISPDICQVRLDFLLFSLAQPNSNGSCTTDTFYILGGASQVPVLCGDNNNQHLYIDFSKSNIQLSFNIQTANAWNIKIIQLSCDCPTKAPTGCLQFYRSVNGIVKSFNYGLTSSQTGTRQLINQNYGVCVEMQLGFCSISWRQSPADIYSFTLTNDTFASVGNGQIGTTTAAIKSSNCTTDFIIIPNPLYANGTAVNSDRFCGNGFVSVTTFSKPFVLTVVTDGNDVNDVGNHGFSLEFTQARCSGMVLG